MTEIERLATALALADANLAPIGIPARLFETMEIEMQDRYRQRVRAILQAMREPSEGMVDAGENPFDWGPPGFTDMPGGEATARKVWRAMIDHILAAPS